MSQIKLSIEVEKGVDLNVTLEDVIHGFLMDKAVVDSRKDKIKEPNDPATPAQIGVLDKHKIPYDVGITKAEASRLIKESMEGA